MTLTGALRHVRVHGAIHRCSLRYSSTKMLDPLLQFMHDALERDSKITALRASFGLPVRLIEDSLAELIRRNLATLDVKNGRIVRIPDAVPTPGHRLRTERQFWQDHVTGAIMPVWVAEKYKRPQADAVALNAVMPIVDFADLPDGRLVSAIERIQAELAFDQDGDWVLDRVIERVRLRPQSLWIPVTTVEAGTSVTHFIDAPGVPPWILRSWAASYQQALATTGSAAHVLTVATSEEDGFEEPGLDFQTSAWSQTVLDLLSARPKPESVYELREFRQRTAKVQIALRALGTAELVIPPTGSTHLETILSSARGLVVMCFKDLEASFVKKLRAAIAANTQPWPFDLCILVGTSDERVLSLRQFVSEHFESRRQIVATADHIGMAADFVIVDGRRAWIGTGQALGSRRPLVELNGNTALRELFSIVQGCLPDSPQGRLWLQHHESVNQPAVVEELRPFGGALASEPVLGVMRELDDLVELIGHAIAQPDILEGKGLVRHEPEPGVAEKSLAGGVPVPPMHGAVEAEMSIGESWPGLFEGYKKVEALLRSPLQSKYGTVGMLFGEDAQIVAERLIGTGPGVKQAVRCMFVDPALALASDAFVRLLKQALDLHWPVQWAVAAVPNLSEAAVRDLVRARINDTRLQVHLLRDTPSTSLVAIGSTVLLPLQESFAAPRPEGSPLQTSLLVTSSAIALGVEDLFAQLTRP